jgi:hypothetical protein
MIWVSFFCWFIYIYIYLTSFYILMTWNDKNEAQRWHATKKWHEEVTPRRHVEVLLHVDVPRHNCSRPCLSPRSPQTRKGVSFYIYYYIYILSKVSSCITVVKVGFDRFQSTSLKLWPNSALVDQNRLSNRTEPHTTGCVRFGSTFRALRT